MTEVRVNLRALVNASKIRREKRDGRDVIIVPSATLPDNIVMNGSGGPIRYPAAVIAESFASLEGRPAPLGHPMVNGRFVSASSPDGIVRGFIGAHNENVRRENGRVFLDKVIDVQFANQSAGGKAVLEAIEKQKPIHTSTGMLATIRPLTNDAEAKFEVESMILDHDCFLLDQPGAATPEQGVGIFVNASGEQIEVINSSIEDDIERDQMWALESLLRAGERKEQIPLLKRILSFIDDVVRGGPEPELNANQETAAMDKAQFDELVAKVNAIADAKPGLTEEKVAEIVANALKPVIDAQEAADKAASEKAEADRQVLVNQVVEAEILTADEAKDVPAAALTKLLANSAAPKPAFRVNGAFAPKTEKTDRAALAPKAEA